MVLPGSANAIGGQAAIIKLRPTEERSPTSMLLEKPYEKNTTLYDPKVSFRYRQMKSVYALCRCLALSLILLAGMLAERTPVRTPESTL